MSKNPLDMVSLAREIAGEAHEGQYRNDRSTPYIKHPEAVAKRVWLDGGDCRAVAVAWLHDVLEDSNYTADDLRSRGIPDEVVEAVRVLTKERWQDYGQYLSGVKANALARRVKIHDMLHNISDGATPRQIVKYAKGLLALVDVPVDGKKGKS